MSPNTVLSIQSEEEGSLRRGTLPFRRYDQGQPVSVLRLVRAILQAQVHTTAVQLVRSWSAEKRHWQVTTMQVTHMVST